MKHRWKSILTIAMSRVQGSSQLSNLEKGGDIEPKKLREILIHQCIKQEVVIGA